MYHQKYTYIQEGGKLSHSEKDFYEKNGFLVVKSLVDHELLDECRQRFVDICNGKIEKGNMTLMKDSSLSTKGVTGEHLINKLQEFAYDDVFFKYCTYKGIVDIVANIIGPDITAVHTMLINKPPDAHCNTSKHPLHQDLHYFPFRPAHLIVASWTAMERINEDNGGLFVIPGSHKSHLYKHDYPPGRLSPLITVTISELKLRDIFIAFDDIGQVQIKGERIGPKLSGLEIDLGFAFSFKNVTNRAYHGVHGLDHLPRVNLSMEKGDTVFFHPLLLHGSGPNRTKGFRKAISAHFANSNCNFIDAKETNQSNIALEVEALASKRGFSNLSFVKVWQYKSRLVSGQPGNFQQFASHL